MLTRATSTKFEMCKSIKIIDRKLMNGQKKVRKHKFTTQLAPLKWQNVLNFLNSVIVHKAYFYNSFIYDT